MTARRIAGLAILAATLLFALAPAYRGTAEIPIREHHLFHTATLIGAALAGILLSSASPSSIPMRRVWLMLSILAPILAMLLMWPSEYSPLEHVPAEHVVEHFGLVLFGFLTGYAGQRYATGLGVAMSASLWLMALAAAWGFGVSPPLQAVIGI
jgi:hypothetical protein